jgi:uncharacterized delta-60 repeat protein
MRAATLRPIATLGLLCALHGAPHARPGDLDPSFGGTGTVRVPVPDGVANDLLVLPDGSVVVGGTGDRVGDAATEFVLARLDATGALVSGFGNGGLVSTPIPLAEKATVRRLALDPDGRILAAGIAETELATGETSRLLRMTRYFPEDGRHDLEFGTNGIRNSVVARDVAGILPRPDRSIAFIGRDDDLVGGVLAQGLAFQAYGFSESSSGSDVVDHLGGVLLGGTVERQFFLRRTLDGVSPDPAFGDGGDVRTTIGTSDRLRKLVVLPDGKILGVGSTTVAVGDNDIGLARYDADGTPDATFGAGGVAVVSLGAGRDEPLDAVLAPDGTVLVAGQTCAPQCRGFLARLLPDGRLDPEFGDDGVVSSDANLMSGLAMPDDGHVLVAEQVLGELVVSRVVVAACGNGRVEAGEACDDGNTVDGDCCAATCTLEPEDAPCADDGSACTADVCRAGTCAHVVPAEAGCFAATASTLKRPADDRLRWIWQSATPVDGALFGDPTAATDVSVCLVAAGVETERAALELTVPAAGTCGAVPCWKQTARGFRYRDPAAGTDGVAKLRLVTGTSGSLVEVRARNLAGVAGLPVPLRVRLVRHDAPVCFEADLGPARGATLRAQ